MASRNRHLPAVGSQATDLISLSLSFLIFEMGPPSEFQREVRRDPHSSRASGSGPPAPPCCAQAAPHPRPLSEEASTLAFVVESRELDALVHQRGRRRKAVHLPDKKQEKVWGWGAERPGKRSERGGCVGQWVDS